MKNPGPVVSPIPWPPAAESGGPFSRVAHFFRWRRQASEVYESVSRQLAERLPIPCPWPPGSIEAEVGALLTEHLNTDQFFGTFTYHVDDPLLLLSVHPVDDMTLVEAMIDVEERFQVEMEIEKNLTDLRFGEAVIYIAGRVRSGKRVEPDDPPSWFRRVRSSRKPLRSERKDVVEHVADEGS